MGLFNFFHNTADINTGVAEYETNDGAVLLDVRTASTYLLIEFLPLRISSRTKAHRFMYIV